MMINCWVILDKHNTSPENRRMQSHSAFYILGCVLLCNVHPVNL